MNRTFKLALVASLVITTVGCTHVESGEINARVGLDKQTKSAELTPSIVQRNIENIDSQYIYQDMQEGSLGNIDSQYIYQDKQEGNR
jgi:hypothetical protein